MSTPEAAIGMVRIEEGGLADLDAATAPYFSMILVAKAHT